LMNHVSRRLVLTWCFRCIDIGPFRPRGGKGVFVGRFAGSVELRSDVDFAAHDCAFFLPFHPRRNRCLSLGTLFASNDISVERRMDLDGMLQSDSGPSSFDFVASHLVRRWQRSLILR